MLPDTLPSAHAACSRVEEEATPNFRALGGRSPGVPNAPPRREELGWVEGAPRRFGCDAPPAGSAALIDVGVHRFGLALSVRDRMAQILAEVRAGKFAEALQAEEEHGYPALDKARAKARLRPVEEARRRLKGDAA